MVYTSYIQQKTSYKIFTLRRNQLTLYSYQSSGNNWGTDPDGRSCTGCGNQEEFYACADVAIYGSGVNTGVDRKTSGPRTTESTGNTGSGAHTTTSVSAGNSTTQSCKCRCVKKNSSAKIGTNKPICLIILVTISVYLKQI